MIDREKVISGLEHCRRGPIGCQQECPYKSDFGCRSQLAADALELMKEHEARVLATDELFDMEHKCVYLERRNSKIYPTEPSIILKTETCVPSLGGKRYILMRENKISDSHWACDYNKDYHNGWRCWSSRPTEEQRKVVKWYAAD